MLSHGVRIIDAPGLADDNSARDAVVKKILKEANAVWLVSNIRRAVNDKTVKDMMPPNFKQALVDRGVLGSLVFIATHTDVLVQSEIIENLKLPPETSLLECAFERTNYFRNKTAADFARGVDLVEHNPDTHQRTKNMVLEQALQSALQQHHEYSMQQMSQLTHKLQTSAQVTQQQRQSILEHIYAMHAQNEGWMHKMASTKLPQGSHFELASFGVSAVGYQTLARLRQGDGQTLFDSMTDTQIPALRAFVLATTWLQRLNGFKAGAELVACLEEAKQAAAMEEEDLMCDVPEVSEELGRKGVEEEGPLMLPKQLLQPLAMPVPNSLMQAGLGRHQDARSQYQMCKQQQLEMERLQKQHSQWDAELMQSLQAQLAAHAQMGLSPLLVRERQMKAKQIYEDQTQGHQRIQYHLYYNQLHQLQLANQHPHQHPHQHPAQQHPAQQHPAQQHPPQHVVSRPVPGRRVSCLLSAATPLLTPPPIHSIPPTSASGAALRNRAGASTVGLQFHSSPRVPTAAPSPRIPAAAFSLCVPSAAPQPRVAAAAPSPRVPAAAPPPRVTAAAPFPAASRIKGTLCPLMSGHTPSGPSLLPLSAKGGVCIFVLFLYVCV